MAGSPGKRPISPTPCAPPSEPRGGRTEAHPERRGGQLYGRRKGRALKPRQEAALARLLPGLRVPLEPGGGLAVETLFPERPSEIWLEIGFGAGEHLVAQAGANPDVGLIGCEAFREGVGKLVRSVELAGLTNVRVHPGDAREVIAALPEGALSRAFLLFPDPWPKARHHKRRFIAPETLDALARAMRPGAELRVATDWPDYVRWTLLHALRHAEFAWPATGPADWRTRPADWPETRYERKARLAGRSCFYLRFLRR
jgi:tRNA (guanine-N7-)-methyltransferase